MKLVTLLFALSSLSALAGDGAWIGSGGEIFQDERNPWFVKMNGPIRYCLKVDSASLSVSEGDFRTAIQNGFQYWNDELAKTRGIVKPGFFTLGPYDLLEVKCEENPDVRFLAGYGSLGDAEIKFLGDPTKYVGIAVRTDYDRTQLHGRGFVYISSDQGPHTYLNSGNYVDHAWSQPKILQYALLHEIGHVVGLPHMGQGLMSEVFLDQILNKDLAPLFANVPIDPFFGAPGQIDQCQRINDRMRMFFGMEANQDCISLILSPGPNGFDASIKAYAFQSSSPVRSLIGEFKGLSINGFNATVRPAIVLHLTPEQTIFSSAETNSKSFLFGPMVSIYQLTGAYIPVKSGVPPQSIFLNVSPEDFSVVGLSGGKVDAVLSYTSPLTLLILTGIGGN